MKSSNNIYYGQNKSQLICECDDKNDENYGHNISLNRSLQVRKSIKPAPAWEHITLAVNYNEPKKDHRFLNKWDNFIKSQDSLVRECQQSLEENFESWDEHRQQAKGFRLEGAALMYDKTQKNQVLNQTRKKRKSQNELLSEEVIDEDDTTMVKQKRLEDNEDVDGKLKDFIEREEISRLNNIKQHNETACQVDAALDGNERIEGFEEKFLEEMNKHVSKTINEDITTAKVGSH